jgi:hypothetical protein
MIRLRDLLNEAVPKPITVDLKRIKVIPSHSGKARFSAEAKRVGWIPRVANIPSPYMYSPVWTVYWWKGKHVVLAETRHRRYEVFEVPENLVHKGAEPD